jgi:hypothetical protein
MLSLSIQHEHIYLFDFAPLKNLLLLMQFNPKNQKTELLQLTPY